MIGLGLSLGVYAGEPATARAQLDMPDASPRNAAIRQVNELRERHPLQYGAARLLKLAQEPSSSPAMRYAATLRAMEIAADAGNVRLAIEALEQVEGSFRTEGAELKTHLLERLLQSPARFGAAVLAMRWSEAAYRDARLKEAAPYARAVEQCQGKLLSSELQQAASAYLDDYRYAASCSPALFSSLYSGHWQENLKSLSECADPLAPLAREDLAAEDATARLQVAHRWWSAGVERGKTTGWRISRRAVEIYRELLPTLGGLEAELISSRLAEHERQSLRAQGYLPGLLREIWRDETSERQSGVVLDLEIDREKANVELPRTGAHVLYRGFLLISSPGEHEITFTAGTTLKVLVDSKPVLENPLAYRKRSGEKVLLELSAGLHRIEIEVSSNSSKPRLHVEWITPRDPEKQSIPQSCFFYDPLEQ